MMGALILQALDSPSRMISVFRSICAQCTGCIRKYPQTDPSPPIMARGDNFKVHWSTIPHFQPLRSLLPNTELHETVIISFCHVNAYTAHVDTVLPYLPSVLCQFRLRVPWTLLAPLAHPEPEIVPLTPQYSNQALGNERQISQNHLNKSF